MGLFNRRGGRPGRGPAAAGDSLLTGSSGINTDKTFGSQGTSDLDSHAAAHVREYAAGKVSFSDTALTDRGSFKAKQQQQQQQQESASPAGPGDNDQQSVSVLGKASNTAQNVAGTLTARGADQQTEEEGKEQKPSAGEAAKGEGTEDGVFLNEEELLSHSSFPIPPDQLVAMARDVLKTGVHKCGKLTEDFSFTAPFIGPLGKKDFASTMETLSLDSVFPDLAPRIYHIRVDPLQPNRVWFTTRPIGTNSGYLTAKLPIPVSPTGKVVELPPQTSSLTFNEKGEVEDFTMGYVMDRRLGNTGGLGGAFGLLYAIGCPFPYPEGRPWSSSWQQRLFNSGNPLLQVAMFTLDRLASFFLPNFLYTSHSRNMP